MIRSADRAPQVKSNILNKSANDILAFGDRRNRTLQQRTAPKVLRVTQTMRQMLAADLRKSRVVSF
jgi:hypothetical protein